MKNLKKPVTFMANIEGTFCLIGNPCQLRMHFSGRIKLHSTIMEIILYYSEAIHDDTQNPLIKLTKQVHGTCNRVNS